MKVGIRKPNIKKSIKARTTGKVKRAVKKSVNPLYGKKGMSYINNPKKAVYNKIYNKTTVGVSDIVHTPKTHSDKSQIEKKYSNTTYKILGIISLISGILFLLIGLISFAVGGFIFIIPSIILILVGRNCLKISKQ